MSVIVISIAVLRSKESMNLCPRGQSPIRLAQDAPRTESGPVAQRSWLTRRLRKIDAADRATQMLQPPGELDFRPLQAVLHAPGWSLIVKCLVNPRHEQCVAHARVKDGRTREEVI